MVSPRFVITNVFCVDVFVSTESFNWDTTHYRCEASEVQSGRGRITSGGWTEGRIGSIVGYKIIKGGIVFYFGMKAGQTGERSVLSGF